MFFFPYVNPTRYLKCVQDLIVNMVWSEVCSLDLQKVNALCWVIVFKLILKTMSQQRTVNLIERNALLLHKLTVPIFFQLG